MGKDWPDFDMCTKGLIVDQVRLYYKGRQHRKQVWYYAQLFWKVPRRHT
uniref:Uncharacterized protein n=1 Tax=Anguilla anguilla TaxID=7936 RepID=A0A0E9V3K9_ANGAN